MKIKNQNIPKLALLCDYSKSMETPDVKNNNEVLTRKDAMETILNSHGLKKLEKKFKLSTIKFSLPPDNSISDIGAALKSCQEKKFNHIILLSDGLHTGGESPITAATKLMLSGTNLHTISIGSEKPLPDLELMDVRLPAYCMVDEQIVIPFSIKNNFDSSVETSVSFTPPGEKTLIQKFDLSPGEVKKSEFHWKANKKGKNKISIFVEKKEGEINYDNNKFELEIDARDEKIKVLLVDSLPRWEYRYIKNALSRDEGVLAEFLLFHPKISIAEGKNYRKNFPNKDEISDFDVIFLGDVGTKQLNKQDLINIKNNVYENASGLVFIPGRQGEFSSLEQSPLNDLMPIISKKDFPKGIQSKTEVSLELTKYGADHHLSMLENSATVNKLLWKNLPGFTWNWAVEDYTPGSRILAIHPYLQSKNGKMPLLVEKNFGSGIVLFMGTDHIWKWRKAVEDKYHYRFWSQVIRWMAHKRFLGKNNKIRVFYEPENPSVGDEVTVKAIFSNKVILQQDDKIFLNISLENNNKNETYPLLKEPNNQTVSMSFIAKNSGKSKISITSMKNGELANTEIFIKPGREDKIGEPA
ncbi:MAG TPA: hypothetical protein PLN24_09780, partial [Victivallales bacterium]|nr:hypothetical protein [Victivallales bacterium]